MLTCKPLEKGFELLRHGRFPGVDLHKVAHVWNHGSILTGTLMTATERALRADPNLEEVAPYVVDSGEGKWTVLEAIEHNIPFTSGAHALFERWESRDKEHYSNRLIAAQRNAFGGHAIKKND